MSADRSPLQDLSRFGAQVTFGQGDILRQSGMHYRDMYIVLDGTANAKPDVAGGDGQDRQISANDPIGEICFLQGTAANATVTATTDLQAIRIDDRQMATISEQRPDLAAWLLQTLAETAAERLSQNLSVLEGTELTEDPSAIEILLCRTEDLRQQAKRLRYEVYCGELGRKSPNADHRNRVISDALDRTGVCFVAQKARETIATLRVNYAGDGPLNELEPIYGMTRSPYFPDLCGICTKFIVDRANRGGPAAMMLIAQAVQMGMRDEMKECYIDCIPDLLDYYTALGFEQSAPEFLHPENGLSIPMRLNLEQHGAQMSGRDGLRRMVRLFLKSRAKQRKQGK